VPSLARVLVANRGEIALRIIRACYDEDLETVLAVSEADRGSLAAQLADRVVCIGPAAAKDSYLDIDRLVAAAKVTGCDALHPGYGFVSERAELSAACEEADIAFVGASPEAMRRSGDKARELGIAIGEGSDVVASEADVRAVAEEMGFPILLKAAAGGGGRGMRRVDRAEDLHGAWASASAEAQQAFGDGRLFVERFVTRARHVEVQVLGDGSRAVALGDRDCSVQRRYQKLFEEAPAPLISDPLRAAMADAALRLAAHLGYRGLGTVELLVDRERDTFYFLEMNARIQVEHPVTEMITGLDLVAEQLAVAEGLPLRIRQEDVVLTGHAVECRINAEDWTAGFRPSPGRIDRVVLPVGDGLRVDTHVQGGSVVPPYYDSLLAKLIVHGTDREDALSRARAALDLLRIEGVTTTVPVHQALLADAEFSAGGVDTAFFERFLGAHQPDLVGAR
jgi:acetyl-CoA carboxylase biotin carboxylase subunit